MSRKREAFVRLATKRTNAVIERLRILGNCSNPYAYEYTEDDVKRVFTAIEREVRETRARFKCAERRRFILDAREGETTE